MWREIDLLLRIPVFVERIKGIMDASFILTIEKDACDVPWGSRVNPLPTGMAELYARSSSNTIWN